MLFGDQADEFLLLPFGNPRGNADVLLLFLLRFHILVFGFLVNDVETQKLDRRTRGAQEIFVPGCFPRHFHLQRVVDRGFHLRGDEALPDQLVEFEHGRLKERLDLLRLAHHRGRADGLVRFLRAHRFGLVYGRRGRQEVLAVFRGHKLTRLVLRQFGDVGRVRAHVGDQAGRAALAHLLAFVESLRQRHRPFGGEAQFTRGLLL